MKKRQNTTTGRLVLPGPGGSGYTVHMELPEELTAQLGLRFEANDTTPTLAEFWPKFIEQCRDVERHKPSEIHTKERHYRRYLKKLLGGVRLTQIADSHVRDLKAVLAGLKAKSVNNILAVLSKAIGVAVDLEVIPEAPVRIRFLRIDKHVPPRFYEFEEFEELVRGAQEAGPEVLAFVLLGGEAGLRTGELIALEWGDIDFRRKGIYIQRAEWRGEVSLPKGGRSRRVPMSGRLMAALRKLPHIGRRVFYRRDGRTTVSDRSFKSWMKRAQRRAGVPVNGWKHILRHTFCSHLAMRGVPVRTIQELAGHESLSTTQRYMHLSPSEAERAIGILEETRSGPREALNIMGTASQQRGVGDLNPRPATAGEDAARQRLLGILARPRGFYPIERKSFTVSQAATHLGVSVSTVYRLIHEGPLIARRVRKRGLRILAEDMESFVKESRYEAH